MMGREWDKEDKGLQDIVQEEPEGKRVKQLR